MVIMDHCNLLSPGTLVRCRDDVREGLTLWPSYRSTIDGDYPLAEKNELLLILESRKLEKNDYDDPTCNLTDEWKLGAYLISNSSGEIGWVGSGWVVEVSNKT